MKRFLWIFLIITLLLSFSSCRKSAPAASPPVPDPSPVQEKPKIISSIEIYNRTGRIQREDFYDASGTAVSYSVEYSYTDAGKPSVIRRVGGGLGENRPIETYFYSGDYCTQRILYDSNGSTQTVYYWNYDSKGKLLTEKIVTMIPSENGYTYSGRREELTTYNADGTAGSTKISLPGDYSLDEYEYSEDGRLITDRYSHSSDDRSYRLFEVRTSSYNAAGLLSGKTVTDGLGNVILLEEFEYDDAGNLLTDITWTSADRSDANVSVRRLFSYDEGGKLLSLEESSGEEKTYTFYEYNSSGKTTVTTVVRYRGEELFDKTVTLTTYDTRLNPVQETIYLNGGNVLTHFICEYSYYDDGKIRTKTNFAV